MNVFKRRMIVQMHHQGHVAIQLEVIIVLVTQDIQEMERFALVGFSTCPIISIIKLRILQFNFMSSPSLIHSWCYHDNSIATLTNRVLNINLIVKAGSSPFCACVCSVHHANIVEKYIIKLSAVFRVNIVKYFTKIFMHMFHISE